MLMANTKKRSGAGVLGRQQFYEIRERIREAIEGALNRKERPNSIWSSLGCSKLLLRHESKAAAEDLEELLR